MFICSECGTKYEIMPKFCDCGNDIFIEESPQPEPQIEESQQEQITPRRKGRGKVESFSPIAIGTFAFCLILAFVILLFIGNPKKEDVAQEHAKEEQIEQPVNIPEINSFWDNTTLKTEQKEEIKEEPQEKPAINIVPKFVQNILPVETKKAQTPKPIKITATKPVSVQKVQTAPKTTVQKSPQQTNSQTNQQAQAVTNRIKSNMQQHNNQTSQLPVQSQPVQTTTQQSVQNKTAPTTQITQTQTTVVNNNPAPTTTQTHTQTPIAKTKSQTELTRELNTYKASLRNTIGRKIDFTKVIGDGDCALTFKINSSGRFISKAFTKQSSNITLNDAVFSAMNSTTSYNPPPEGYKGEALTLRIRFYNGNFEITLN